MHTHTQTLHKISLSQTLSPVKHILNSNEVTACDIFSIKPLLPFAPGKKGTKQSSAIKGIVQLQLSGHCITTHHLQG